jgi:hypothetical protein
MWTIFSIIVFLGLVGLGSYNIISLIRKWKHNPNSWMDLLVGIIIWLAGLGAMAFILFKHVP